MMKLLRGNLKDHPSSFQLAELTFHSGTSRQLNCLLKCLNESMPDDFLDSVIFALKSFPRCTVLDNRNYIPAKWLRDENLHVWQDKISLRIIYPKTQAGCEISSRTTAAACLGKSNTPTMRACTVLNVAVAIQPAKNSYCTVLQKVNKIRRSLTTNRILTKATIRFRNYGEGHRYRKLQLSVVRISCSQYCKFRIKWLV